MISQSEFPGIWQICRRCAKKIPSIGVGLLPAHRCCDSYSNGADLPQMYSNAGIHLTYKNRAVCDAAGPGSCPAMVCLAVAVKECVHCFSCCIHPVLIWSGLSFLRRLLQTLYNMLLGYTTCSCWYHSRRPSASPAVLEHGWLNTIFTVRSPAGIPTTLTCL